MRYLLALLFLSLTLSLFSQTAPPVSDEVFPNPVTEMQGDSGTVTPNASVTLAPDTNVYQWAEVMPEFPGGEDSLKKYVSDSTRQLPTVHPIVRPCTSYIMFTVEKDGSRSYVHAAKGIHGGPELDREAVRVVNSMPKWSPGQINGQPVRVTMVVPVKFF